MEGEKWWSEETVGVVTGGNRGIGLEIVRLLAEQGITVVLTDRLEKQQLSEEAQALLEQGKNNVVFHKLDVQSDDSVLDFAEWLKKEFGGLDILINNAGNPGVEFDWDLLQKNNMDFRKIMKDESWVDGWPDGVTENYETAQECLETNYYGTKRTTKALLPLMKPSAGGPRIVNVSSRLGLVTLLRSQLVQKQLSDIENINEDIIESIINRFFEDVKHGLNLKENIWPLKFPTYSLSKVALNAYTQLVARDMKGKVWVNSVHPGFVRTEMTCGNGDLSPVEAAENVTRVALFPPGGPTGQFFYEKKLPGF